MSFAATTLRRLVVEEHGIQHVEEALLLALIAIAAMATVKTLGTHINDKFSAVDLCMDQGTCS